MRFFFLILLLFPFIVKSQITDDFTDGDFTNNPVWMGDAAQFKINTSLQLQLNSLIADTSYLNTASTYINNAEWHFWEKLSFTTSTNNYGRVYLVSDQSNLQGPLNGYYVQIGDASKRISLYKQTGLTSTVVITGTIASTGHSTNPCSIKVTRDNLGNWNLYTDTLSGINYTLEGSALDNTFTTSAYMGVFCKYTVSNITKFYFDNFYAGPIIVDTIPPAILSLNVISQTQLDVLFSENVDVATAQTLTNYQVNNSIGNPSSALTDGLNGALVHLTFTTPFTDGLLNMLTVINVKDLNNNAITSVSQNFSYYIVKQFDVQINELMVDPDPPVGLPNYEYVELYNKTNVPINLNGWTLMLGSSAKVLANVTILPDSFLIITSTTALPLFTTYGPVIDFSSVSLTNTGMDVILKDAYENIISFVSYTDAWYQDNSKKDGGWSLEQIDPANPCGGSLNWRASVNASGGTPGKKNSVYASNPDHTAPTLTRVGIIDVTHIQAWFSESLDSTYLAHLSNYTIDNSIGQPTSASPVGPDYTSVKLTLSSALQTDVIYTLTITDTITDCVGNIISANNHARFAIPVAAVPNDIIVNEVLSNPKDNSVDFIEIYNRSSKVIDLMTLTLSSYDSIAGILTSVNDISADGFLIFPQEYYVLTSDPAKVKFYYTIQNQNAFVQMSMPSFNNDDGIVVIADKGQQIIDKFIYTLGMQFPLLNTTKGVSLERLCPERLTNDKTNWHSASEPSGFATPGYRNSQYNCNDATTGTVELTPEIFSPDNDGYNDVLNINYSFDAAGYMATISIFDSRGRIIKTLAKSEMLGSTGSFSWNGITDDNEKAPIGIYIIYFEAFDLKGNTSHYKKTAVLGGKL